MDNFIEDGQKHKLDKQFENKFPGLQAENISSLQETNRDALPKLLK